MEASRSSWARTLGAWRLTACALVAGCATAPPGTSGSRIYRGISLDELQGEMQQMGLRAERKSEGDTSWLESGTSGYHFSVLVYDCDPIDVCEDIMLRSGFENESSLGLDFVNRWNAQTRFGRVYLDGDGDFAVEMDLPAKGGITGDEIRYVLGIWDGILNGFANEAWEASGDDAPGASP